MVKSGQKCSIMVENGHLWTKMVIYGQKCSVMDENGQLWSVKMLSHGQKWSKVVKRDKIDQKVVKNVQSCKICVDPKKA